MGVAVLGSLVGDADLCLGIFPPLNEFRSIEVPLGVAGVALVQAALFNDVKLWPVAFPDAVRVRWDYSLRSLRHMLTQRREMDFEVNESEDRGANTDTLLDEVLPSCL